MTRLVAGGIFVVVAAEATALLAPGRRAVLWLSGAAVAMLLLAMRRRMTTDPPPADPAPGDAAAESLRRWITRTQAMLTWADGSRADWDRHLRPKLAREFTLATGQRQGKDAAAQRATGQMLFGADLWQWVDPSNVARGRAEEPGPGRATLDEILRRLERL